MKNIFVTSLCSTLAIAALVCAAPEVANATPWCYRQINGPPDGPCTVMEVQNDPNTTFRGYVMIVAMGGWVSTPGHVTLHDNVLGSEFRALGLSTYTVEITSARTSRLRNGAATGDVSVLNTLQHYDELRGKLKKKIPICIAGSSSGGQLAALGAILRPSINCVILIEAPMNLATLSQPIVRAWAVEAFTEPLLPLFSPQTYYFANPHQNWLIGHSTNDVLVGPEQSSNFAQARCASSPTCPVELYQAPPGNEVPFGHGTTTFAGEAAFWATVGTFAPWGTIN